MNKFYLLASLWLLSACATTQDTAQTFSMTDDQYQQVIETYSDHVQKYDGPYNVLEVNATLLNSQIIEAQTLRRATVFQWDKMQYQKELQTRQEHAKEKTEVFVSLFTPDRKSGDLMRADTLWKTLLRVNNKEYTGKAKKINLLPVEISNIYPQHNRWSTGYIVTFDLPVKSIEQQNAELVITGPVGSANLEFRQIKEVNKTSTN